MRTNLSFYSSEIKSLYGALSCPEILFRDGRVNVIRRVIFLTVSSFLLQTCLLSVLYSLELPSHSAGFTVGAQWIK